MGTKFRNVQMVSPAVIYLFLKSKGIYIKRNDYLSSVHWDKKLFLKSIKPIAIHYPDYLKRKRSELINSIILSISKEFSFKPEFISHCRRILQIFVPYLSVTKENVIAAILIKQFLKNFGEKNGSTQGWIDYLKNIDLLEVLKDNSFRHDQKEEDSK